MTQRGGETSSLHRKMTERHNGEEKPPMASKNAEQHDEQPETSSWCGSLEAAAVVVAIVGVSSCRCSCCCDCCHFRCRRSGCEGGWMWWTWIGTWVWCLRCFILIRWCWVLGADALSCHVEGRAVRVGPLGRSNITIYRHHVVS